MPPRNKRIIQEKKKINPKTLKKDKKGEFAD